MLRHTTILAAGAVLVFALSAPIHAATQSTQGATEVVEKTCKAGYTLNTRTNKCVKKQRGSFH